MTSRRSLVQRSKSTSGNQNNPVNMIAPEPMKGFQPNPTQIFQSESFGYGALNKLSE